MHQQKAGLQDLDTEDLFENDGQYAVQNNKKNMLQQMNLNHNKRENTQFTQSTAALSHHLMQGCGTGSKFQTQLSVSSQSIHNNYIDNSILSKNNKDDQSETLYLTTQQSPKSTKNYSSSDQQQFSSMSQFQYICQKFQLKMEDIMQIMKGFQDKDSQKLQQQCQQENTSPQNQIQKDSSLQERLNQNKMHNQMFDQLLVPQQSQMNLRFQSEVSQTQSLNENGEQEEQQFSEQAPSYNVNLDMNSNEDVQTNHINSRFSQSSQDMPLQYQPYILKGKSLNDGKQSIQLSQREPQMLQQKQELQKSQQYQNSAQNFDTGSNNSSRQNSQYSQNQINLFNQSQKQKVDNQNNNSQLAYQKNEIKQQLSLQSNPYNSFNNNKNASFNSKGLENNQKSDMYYETSIENQSQQQQQQQKEDNQKQSVYSEQSQESDSYSDERLSSSDLQIPPTIPQNMRQLENEAEDFSCPMQFIKGGFIVYSINNGIKNYKIQQQEENLKQKEQQIATEINLFTSQSEHHNCNQEFEQIQNQQKQINEQLLNSEFHFIDDGVDFNEQNLVENNNYTSGGCQIQSDQKLETQISNQAQLQTEEISFTNQTFENRISRRLSEKNYLSNEYMQNNKNSFSSSIQPQYTQERSDEEEEQDYQQQAEDNDYAELERLKQLANGNSQIRMFTNRQSQYQKQNSQQESKMQENTSNNSSQQQNGMSIKEMKMSKQYQDPIHQIGQINYPSFNNSNQIFGYQTEEKSDKQSQQQQQLEHFLEDYQSDQNYFNQNSFNQQQQNQIIQNENKQSNRNTFCNNSIQQSNSNSIQPNIKNSMQQFGLESFGDLSQPVAQQNQGNQYGVPNFQKEESFNDQFSQTFSQHKTSQNFDSLNLNAVYQDNGHGRESNYKQDGQLQSYYQNSTSCDQSQQGNSQNNNYFNQSNNSYQNYIAQMIERYEEEIKRLSQENQKQNLEIGELNGKLQGIQETKKDFELVIQSLKQNLQCVTDLLKKKEEDYNKLFEKYNNLVEQIQRSESKNKYRRETSPSKEQNVQDSIDRYPRQYDLRSSSSKENRNSQEKAIKSTESPNNILSQRDTNCMLSMEKQTSRKNLNFDNSQFYQFKPPMIKNPKKLVNYDENNSRTLKKEFSESQLGQRQPFQQTQVVQKIVQKSMQNEQKQDKENIYKFSKRTSLSPNQQESRNNTNRSKSPTYGLGSARMNDENQKYQEPQRLNTKRENLSGTRAQDTFLSSTKMTSNSQNRYSDQYKKQKSNSYLQTNNFVQQDKQVLDELRNYCFRKK